MNTLRKSLTVAALAVAAGSASQARAEIFLTATDGTNTISVNDLATPGTVYYDGAIGNFTTSFDYGLGYPATGLLTQPSLDLSSADLTTGTTGGTLTISLSETGFPSTGETKEFLSSITGRYVSSQATMSTYFDALDTPFGTANPLSTGLVDNQSDTIAVPPIAGPYSLTAIITVNAGANSLASIDAGIIDTPEPGSLVLLGSALLGLAGLGAGRCWRRAMQGRRRPAAA